MDDKEYKKYLKLLINKSDISEEDFSKYLKLINILKYYDEDKLNKMEDVIFTVDGNVLPDKLRIYYELKILLNINDIDINKDIKKVLYLYDTKGIDDNTAKIKIMEIQFNNSLDTKFFGSYKKFLDKELDEEYIEKPKTR